MFLFDKHLNTLPPAPRAMDKRGEAEIEKEYYCSDASKEKLLQMSEIGLWLDHYDDIFSDFDPRHYSERALSDDFLQEAKRASRDKVTGAIEIKFLVPKHRRNSYLEAIIKKRLRQHFRKHYLQMKAEKIKTINQGLTFALMGIFLMFIATYILVTFPAKNILSSFLVVLLEPGGWFLFWEGLDQAVFEVRKINPDVEFYEKMSRAGIHFVSY